MGVGSTDSCEFRWMVGCGCPCNPLPHPYIIISIYIPLVVPTTPPSSPLRMNSVNVEQSYRGILARADSIDARRAAGLEESITSLSRQRYASLRHDDNILGSYLNGDAIEGVETVTEETDVSETTRYTYCV